MRRCAWVACWLGLASAACAVGLGSWELSPVWREYVSPEAMLTAQTRSERAAVAPPAHDAKPTCTFAAVQEGEREVSIEEGCGWHLPAQVTDVHVYSPEGANGMVPQRLPEGCLVLRTPWLAADAVADIRGFRPCPDCDALGMPLAGWKECR